MRGRNTGGVRQSLPVCVVAGLAVGLMAGIAASAPPNIVVIVADDLGFSDLGCYGGEIDTPNLDRLAAGGLRYTQATNTARCWPTRAALLTGYYPQAIRRDALPGGQGGAKGARPAWARLLPELLEPAGYRAYHSGKWHVDGEPLAQGFARSLDVNATGQSNYFDPAGVRGAGVAEPPADFYVTSAIGDHAVACLAEHARERAATPFFQYVAFTAPHFPLQAPPDLIAKVRDRYRAGWDAIRAARIARVKELGIVTSQPAAVEPDVGPPYAFPEALEALGPDEVNRPQPWATLTPAQREFQAEKMAIHAAMVEALDHEVGRIVTQLEAMQALDDTLILFLSDNGASAEIMVRGAGHDRSAPPGSRQTFLCLGPGWSTACNAPFRRHKTWVHEGGIATPWIVHWPRGCAARGGLRHQPVHVVDVVPTVLELAEVGPPRELAGAIVPPRHGRSFAASLSDPAAPPAHDVLWWCHEGHRAVRVGDMKLVAVKQEPWELYDLASDRCETKDLAAARVEQVKSLEDAWERIAAECRALAASGRPPAQAKPRLPNIVFFLCDDLGTGDLSCLGSRDIQTPHIDALFARGTRLTRHWAGSAVCAPSRCVLLTGRHPGHAVIRSNREAQPEGQAAMPAGTVTLAGLLREAGYETGAFGKWGLGGPGSTSEPLACGFERFFGYNCQREAHSYYPQHLWSDRDRIEIANQPVPRGGKIPAEPPPSEAAFAAFRGTTYSADLIAAELRAFVKAHAARPFFLYVPTTVPHLALQVPADEPMLVTAGKHFGDESPYLGGRGYVPCRRPLATYAAMIGRMDREVGGVVALLDELNLAENTIIVFSSDNGATMPGTGGLDTKRLASNGPLRGWKGTPYEGGLRVPTVAVWPGRIPAGRTIAAPTGFEDWLPTLLDLAGLPDRVPEGLDGESLAAVLLGQGAAPDPRLLYRELTESRWQAASDGRWKAIRRAAGPKRPVEPGPIELYDLGADPAETTNVADRHPAVVERMRASLDHEHVPDSDWPLPFADAATEAAASVPAG